LIYPAATTGLRKQALSSAILHHQKLANQQLIHRASTSSGPASGQEKAAEGKQQVDNFHSHPVKLGIAQIIWVSSNGKDVNSGVGATLSFKIMMEYIPKRRNLICVLDWGLGHASRSLALAERLKGGGEEVLWAAAGAALDFIRRACPEDISLELPSYAVRYPSRSMVWNVVLQAPRWWRVARSERRLLRAMVQQHGIERIISDNRFGCHLPDIESIWLSHQLHPIVPLGIVSWGYRQYLRRCFHQFWVPDDGDKNRISGKLSSPKGYEEVHFIGQLSRLGDATRPYPAAWHPGLRPPQGTLKLLILLSGPEPMRTRLEEVLVSTLATASHEITLVRGLPRARATSGFAPPAWETHNFADAGLLSNLLSRVDLVICRSGYSTMMDLRAMGKPAILIPTPGQTEQIYLAQRAESQGWVAVLQQDEVPRILGLIGQWKAVSVKNR
jgi:hypothetical protein